jgi:hypothetical protein
MSSPHLPTHEEIAQMKTKDLNKVYRTWKQAQKGDVIKKRARLDDHFDDLRAARLRDAAGVGAALPSPSPSRTATPGKANTTRFQYNYSPPTDLI